MADEALLGPAPEWRTTVLMVSSSRQAPGTEEAGGRCALDVAWAWAVMGARLTSGTSVSRLFGWRATTSKRQTRRRRNSGRRGWSAWKMRVRRCSKMERGTAGSRHTRVVAGESDRQAATTEGLGRRLGGLEGLWQGRPRASGQY